MVDTSGDPSLKSHRYVLANSSVSEKTTVRGTHPEVSLATPLIEVLIPAPTPARLNAILMANKLQELLLFVVDHAQVALNEEKDADENQQKINDIKSSIRESLIEDENGDVLVNGQNPMNAVLNKK